jgi:lysophospholipase L1-like esterase
MSLMKPGDYLFIEFAHNDQKQGSAYVEPFTTYKEQLKLYISEARNKGGIPVLVTSMHRRSFDSTGHINNTLGDYPEAMRQAAAEEKVALIDLNAMSKTLYESWGPETSLNAFVHYPANSFPGQTQALKDNTHFSTYGAYELARCVVEGIKANVPELARSVVSDLPPFDPAQPDPLASWNWPLSPMITAVKPDGN